MKSLVFPLSLCIAVATAAVPEAQEARDGSAWTGGGVTLTLHITEISPNTVSVQATTSAGNNSDTVTGNQGSGSTPGIPTCSDSATMTVPTASGGAISVKVSAGEAVRWNGSAWVPMRKRNRCAGSPNYGGNHGNSPGNGVDSLPFDANGAISFEEWRAMTITHGRNRSAWRN